MEERLGIKGTKVPLSLPINDTLNIKPGATDNAGGASREDRKQQTSTAVEARGPSVEPFLVWLGKVAIRAMIDMEQVV